MLEPHAAYLVISCPTRTGSNAYWEWLDKATQQVKRGELQQKRRNCFSGQGQFLFGENKEVFLLVSCDTFRMILGFQLPGPMQPVIL